MLEFVSLKQSVKNAKKLTREISLLCDKMLILFYLFFFSYSYFPSLPSRGYNPSIPWVTCLLNAIPLIVFVVKNSVFFIFRSATPLLRSFFVNESIFSHTKAIQKTILLVKMKIYDGVHVYKYNNNA